MVVKVSVPLCSRLRKSQHCLKHHASPSVFSISRAYRNMTRACSAGGSRLLIQPKWATVTALLSTFNNQLTSGLKATPAAISMRFDGLTGMSIQHSSIAQPLSVWAFHVLTSTNFFLRQAKFCLLSRPPPPVSKDFTSPKQSSTNSAPVAAAAALCQLNSTRAASHHLTGILPHNLTHSDLS